MTSRGTRTLPRNLRAKHVAPGLYRHYKGGRYLVLGLARHSETLEEVVVYQALHASEFGDCALWVRPAAMFREFVIVDGRRVQRFAREKSRPLSIKRSRTLRSPVR